MIVTPRMLLAASYHFESFATDIIRTERRVMWVFRAVLCMNVAVTVWTFPVTNWLEVVAVLANLASAVLACDALRRSRGMIADMTEARAMARRTIDELEVNRSQSA